MLYSVFKRSCSQDKIMKANRFQESKSYWVLHSASSINSPWNQGQDTRFCRNTGSRLTNTLLSVTATSAAVKYPVGLDSSSRRIQLGEGESRCLNRSWSDLLTPKWYTATNQSPHCQFNLPEKTNLTEAVILSFTQQCIVQFLAPNNTWGARIATATAPAVKDWQHLSWHLLY